MSLIRIVICVALLLTYGGQAPARDYHHLSIVELRSLAERGDPAAQVELGEALEHGEGLPRDPMLAVKWYCRAAAGGSADAQRNLGWMYFNGRGVPADDGRAAYWLNKAAAAGDVFAKRQLTRLADSGAPRENGCEQVASRFWLAKRCSRSNCRDIINLVESLSLEYGLDTNLVLSVISAESAFNSRAVSRKGAQGLMQLMPATARRFGVENAWDPEQNIRGGMAYLRWLLGYFKGDVKRALAGYNAGEHAVRRYGGVPPFPETRAYIRRIIRDYGKNRHRYDKSWMSKSLLTQNAVKKRSVPFRVEG